jgi:omega-amidase
VKYAMYQMDIIPGKPEENRKKVKKWIDHVVIEDNPDTIVLPEMWTTAYTLPELNEVADLQGEPTTTFLGDLAKKHKVNIIGGSVANKVGDKIFNSAFVLNRQGEVVYQYDKIHLVPMLDEHVYLNGGEKSVEVFELDGVKMGVVICYDLRFPELARSLALEGVQALHIVAEWPSARKQHWRALQIARAIENQMYVITCNRVGSYNGVDFAGMSMVTDPWGDVLLEGSESNEASLNINIDLAKVNLFRKEVPVFDSRVAKLYKS